MDEDKSLCDAFPPKSRRRSSLMNRRRSVALPPAVEDAHQSTESLSATHLKEYISQTKKETDQWYKLFLERKAAYKSVVEVLDKVKELPPILDFDSLENDLTEGDKKFISQMPDYNQITRGIENVLEKMGMLQKKVSEVNQHACYNLLIAQSRLNAVKGDVCSWADGSLNLPPEQGKL